VPRVADIRAQAVEVAAGWSPPGAPDSWRLTAGLFTVIAEHEELLERLTDLPADRLPALLASAAIALTVRRHDPEPPAGYFPQPGQPQPQFGPGFGPAARAFVSEHLAEIVAVCREHRYQMNEVARCGQIALGIAAIAGPARAPVALADLGTGAGLGLQLDRYRYRIGGQAYGPDSAGLILDCEIRGPGRPPPATLPPIASRAGIELSPVDLQDPAARAWLQACAPPEASALARLTAAMEVTLRNPATIIAGDAVTALPALLASLPPQLPVIVTDAYLAVFLPAEQREELTAVLAAAGRARPVTWLSLDPLIPLGPHGRDSVQGLPLPDALVSQYQRHGVFAVLGARTFDGDIDTARLLARAHPSGQWVEWLDAPSVPAR
jgi:hypothetical protein